MRGGRNSAAAVALCAAVLLVGPTSAGAITLPPGFVDEQVAAVNAATAFAFLPDGRLLIARQGGQLYVTPTETDEPTLVLSLTSKMCTQRERGLLGLAIDPGFASNRFIYLYYTAKRLDCGAHPLLGAANRISRFVLRADDTIDPVSETVLIDGIPNKGEIHNAGDLNFGKDGYLYATSGDGGCDYAGNGCGNLNDAARDMHALLGKVLRITRDGGIPADNPFRSGVRCRTGPAQPGQTCAEIWATGLRNPFRFVFDPNAAGTRLFIHDVGSATWEEIDQGSAAADYGWNIREGNCATGSKTDCSLPPIGLTNPIYAYAHNGCGSITGGAIAPAGAWPAPWDRSYFFADFVCGKIFRLLPPSAGGGYTSEDFATGLGSGSPVHLRFGPAPGGQALYYSAYGSSVRRIRHVGNVNRAPTAALTADPLVGTLPLEVTFDASQSFDPDGDALTFIFTFGDGTPAFETTQPTATHTYASNGDFTATVRVRDPAGTISDPVAVRISAGNTAPALDVLDPSPELRFSVGEDIPLRATATDAEDGTLPGSAIEWSARLFHNDHFHPYLPPTTGESASLTGPAPEDLLSTQTSWLEVTVRATDSRGVATDRTFVVKPKLVRVNLTANRRVQMTANGVPFYTDKSFFSWPGYGITVVAPEMTDLIYRFKNWTDGSRSTTRVIITPQDDSYYRAVYAVL